MELVKLLNCLADGAYHSGVELGEAQGVTRTAVWKALGKLEEMGVSLETTKGKGYRIEGGLDLLDRDLILAHAVDLSLPIQSLFLLQSIDSTNSYLMTESHNAGPDDYLVCMAERQTAGRGRRGRVWHSPYAKNLYISLSFNLTGGVESLDGLSLALGVAVANCLSARGIQNVGLKWPNDIWVNNKKLAGILVELKGEAESGWKVVAGLGLNVLMAENEETEIGQPWTSISSIMTEDSLKRSQWAGLLVASLIDTIERYKKGGLKCLLGEWGRYDILCNKTVAIVGNDESGVCKGVDERGRLLIDFDGVIKVVNAGEVSVRPDESSN